MSVHADEASDEGVVPIKRSNNGGLPPAETVEGRTSPKENGDQVTAVRTPSRGAASSRLDAVRQVAREGPGSVASQLSSSAAGFGCAIRQRPRRASTTPLAWSKSASMRDNNRDVQTAMTTLPRQSASSVQAAE
jgi:hypothetical protein